MNIAFEFLGVNSHFNHKTLTRNLIKHILRSEKKELGELSFIFTDNSHILSINKDFLNHNYFTDVITFNNSRKNILNGDIFISLEQVVINTRRFNTTYKEELFRVIIHGVLHLIGYKDELPEEKAEMRSKENEYLKTVKTLLS